MQTSASLLVYCLCVCSVKSVRGPVLPLAASGIHNAKQELALKGCVTSVAAGDAAIVDPAHESAGGGAIVVNVVVDDCGGGGGDDVEYLGVFGGVAAAMKMVISQQQHGYCQCIEGKEFWGNPLGLNP
mmetsp:Transcript_33167/g.44204  ORF Transcript_33167/g.44204 Transcript_33167/m.44204 type:complete len:128 (-) Transcript_33167:1211-1594(-)